MYARTFFCSSPPTPSISSGTCPSELVYRKLKLGSLGFPQLTLSRSAPASINTTAASPCPDSKARCSGVFPARSEPFSRVFGRPSGGFSSICRKAFEPVVAARCKGNCDARSFALIYCQLFFELVPSQMDIVTHIRSPVDE